MPSKGEVKYTDRELTKHLKQISDKIGHTPNISEYYKYKERNMANAKTIIKRFGSWDKATQKAKLPDSLHIRRKMYTDEELIQDLSSAALSNPDIHTVSELIKLTTHAKFIYFSRFGGLTNVKSILANKYGIYLKRHYVKDSETIKKLYIKKITEFRKQFGYIPTLKEFEKWSKMPIHSLKDIRYNELLYLACGSVNRYSHYSFDEKTIRKMIRQKLYEAYLNISNKENLSCVAVRKASGISGEQIRRHFKTLREACSYFYKSLTYFKYVTKEQIIENILSVYHTEGKINGTIYVNSPQHKHSLKKIRREFGSWNNALKVAGIPTV